jgi:FixJ family two-component response regulator
MEPAAELRVVCVDTDPAALESTAAAIDAESDMHAIPVDSAADALEAVESDGADCLVTEFDLDDDTGIDLAERVRELRPGLGCILFTDASAETVSGREGDVLVEYLSKAGPDATDRLCEFVRTVVVNRFHVGYPVPADEDERLAAVREYDVPALSTVATFDRLTRLIATHFDIAVAFVGLLDADHERFIACHGADWDTLAREDSVCTYAILEDALTVIPDVGADPRFEANETLRELDVRSYAGANITSRDGHTIGQLCLIHDEPRTYTERELADLALFADEVSEQLELRRRLAEPNAGSPP